MFYADDSQTCIAINPERSMDTLHHLKKCIEDVFLWNTRNMLLSSPGKTEILHFTSHLTKQPYGCMSVCSSVRKIVLVQTYNGIVI